MSIALVQKVAGVSGGGASFGVAFGSNNAAGNLLVCLTRGFSAIALAASNPVTDSQGNTWVFAGSVAHGTVGPYYIYYAANCKAGANTVTVTYAVSTFPIVLLAEYSGIATSSPLDQVTSADDTTGLSSTYNSGSVTTTQASELLVGATGTEGGLTTTVTPDAGWTNEQQERSGTIPDLAMLDQIVASAGSYANTGTFNTGRGWGAIIATFKAAATTFSISGNAGVAGATVTLSGASSAVTTADGSGNFTFSGLLPGSYTVTPTLAKYRFSPGSLPATVTSGNITGLNFTAKKIVLARSK